MAGSRSNGRYMGCGTIKTGTNTESCNSTASSVLLWHGESPAFTQTEANPRSIRWFSNHLNPMMHFFKGVDSVSLQLNVHTARARNLLWKWLNVCQLCRHVYASDQHKMTHQEKEMMKLKIQLFYNVLLSFKHSLRSLSLLLSALWALVRPLQWSGINQDRAAVCHFWACSTTRVKCLCQEIPLEFNNSNNSAAHSEHTSTVEMLLFSLSLYISYAFVFLWSSPDGVMSSGGDRMTQILLMARLWTGQLPWGPSRVLNPQITFAASVCLVCMIMFTTAQ